MVSQDHLLCFSALLAWGLATVAEDYCVKKDPVDIHYFDIFDTGERHWRLAFRASAHVNQSVFQAYKDGTGVPSNSEVGCMKVDHTLPCSHHYRNNDILDNWRKIDEVAVVLYKGRSPAHYIIFDAAGTGYMNWLRRDKVKNSSWTDLMTERQDHFSISGVSGWNVNRRFYISQKHSHSYSPGKCQDGAGWLAITEERKRYTCPWEKKGTFPNIFYADGTTFQKWTSGRVEQANILAVFVKPR